MEEACMRNLKTTILGALVLVGISGASGCSARPELRYERPWPEPLRGAMSMSCRNFDHLGYGMHYDIVLNDRDRRSVTRDYSLLFPQPSWPKHRD
jgi:hypothetical protein